MAHFDMSNGTLTVNGKTSNMFCLDTCSCGQLSYKDLFNLSSNVTPKDEWFPREVVFFRGLIVQHNKTLPNIFPLVTLITTSRDYLLSNSFVSPKSTPDYFLVYSNSSTNSFIVSNLSSEFTVDFGKPGCIGLKKINE